MFSTSSHKRLNAELCQAVVGLVLFFSFVWSSQAGLKIYYIRHAEGGHNVVKQYKNVPKDQWPDYVGNADAFTPKGKTQVAAATERLKKLKFDFIAVSPAWRTRHTVLPYLRAVGAKGEIWPELNEFGGAGDVLAKDLPNAKREKIIEAGKPVELPDEEKDVLRMRNGAQKHYELPQARDARRNAAIRLVSEEVIELITKRFGGSNKSILLVGHGNSGRALLKMLTKDNLDKTPSMTNTGIWMVEEQPDRAFELKIYNDAPCEARAAVAAQ